LYSESHRRRERAKVIDEADNIEHRRSGEEGQRHGAGKVVPDQPSPTARRTMGMNAAPPSRGTGTWCELRSLGTSNSARFTAIQRAIRTVVAANITTEAERTMSRIADVAQDLCFHPGQTFLTAEIAKSAKKEVDWR
jgi:hypothetical protein